MKPIADVAGEELVWTQPSVRKQAYELRAGDEVVGTLHWHRASLATAEADGQQWTFKREGFWHPRVTVRLPDSDDNLALFRPSWTGGGTLELPESRALRFGAANFWHSQWAWQAPDGQELVHFSGRQGLLKHEAVVNVDADARDDPDLPLLVLLGWYLLILFSRDAAAATAGSVAATA